MAAGDGRLRLSQTDGLAWGGKGKTSAETSGRQRRCTSTEIA